MTKFPLRIMVRPLLTAATLAFDEQKNLFVHQVVFLINSEQPKEEQVVSLWHETLHLLLMAAGKKAPHDETWVEARAQELAKACPDIFEKMGLP